MRTWPLFGAGVFSKSAVVTRQRRVNCYYENRPDGDKSKVVVFGTPGLVRKFTLATAGANPIRAILGVNESRLYAVINNQFQSLSATGSVVASGAISTIAGLCSMAPNPAGSQVMVVDGVGGWIWNGSALVPAPNGSWFVPGARTVTNVGGYFVCEVPGTAQFAVSNLNDATTGNALSVGTAAAYPDVLAAVDNLGGMLIAFCQQHMEFWQPIGAPPPGQPFGPIQSAANQWGLAAVFSRARLDDSLIFLGETPQGTRRVCQVRGFAVQPISEEIDAAINTAGFVYEDAVALTYQRDKHPFYQLTFPTMGRSFLFDASTGIWNETQSGLSNGQFVRHRANLSTYYAGDTVLTDYQNGNVYRMDDQAYTDDGAPVLREVITRHTTRGFNRFRVPQLYLDMETGVGLNGPSTLQGVRPVISIECSKDNGRTWIPPRILELGRQGAYNTRVVARRWGQGRVFTWRIRVTDPVKFVITDGAIAIKGKPETR